MTSAQAEAFHRDGFVRIPGLFSPAEVAPALAALEELRATVLARPEKHAVRYSSRPPGPIDVWGVSNIMTPGLYDDRLAEVLAHPGLLGFVQEVLGPRLRFWTAHALWSPEMVDYELSWHKDNEEHEYYEASGRPTHVQFNVCLTADDAFRVVPGSHRRPLTDAEREEIGRLGSGELPGEVLVPCEAGDVLFFNHHAVHRGSCENGGPRRTLHMNLQAANEPVGGQTSWKFMREPGYLETVHPTLREMMRRTIEWDDAHPISRAEAMRRLRSKRDILARDAKVAR